MAAQPSSWWMRSDGVTGECPEWQRELTVNQPSYDFEGSSPSSPTNRCSRGLTRKPETGHKRRKAQKRLRTLRVADPTASKESAAPAQIRDTNGDLDDRRLPCRIRWTWACSGVRDICSATKCAAGQRIWYRPACGAKYDQCVPPTT